MDDLRLTISVEAAKDITHRVDAPADIRTDDFIRELVEGLNLEEPGGRVWKIRDHHGNALDGDKTLVENGIGSGQRLFLYHHFEDRVEPEAKSGPIKVTVITQAGDGQTLETSQDAKPEELVDLILSSRHIPRVDSEGRPVSWSIDDKDTGKTLDFSRTLASNNVRDGHCLHLRRQVIAGGSPYVAFTTYCPRELTPKSSNKLLAYVHLEAEITSVEQDAKAVLGQQRQNHSQRSAWPSVGIKRGAEIKVVPRLPGCVINPPFFQIVWTENWHRAEFQVEAQAKFSGSKIAGSVSFYVGPILVAEVEIESRISLGGDADSSLQSSTAKAYSAVFVSYSHRDSEIVEDLEKAYSALGLDYLRDIRELRSGEGWNRALLQKIEEADIFQLCWSASARSSQYVEQEWRHALKQERANFIRPLYWEDPMPAPPGELAGIHFAFLDLGGGNRIFRRVRRWFGWA